MQEAILWHGNIYAQSASFNESSHRWTSKKPYRRSKKSSNVVAEMARRLDQANALLWEDHLLELQDAGEDEVVEEEEEDPDAEQEDAAAANEQPNILASKLTRSFVSWAKVCVCVPIFMLTG